MEALIASAARLPKHRRPTKPAKEKRLQMKKHQSQKKTDRSYQIKRFT
jgi:ribosome-associated protein